MTSYVLFRQPGSLGPDFDEASKRLRDNPQVLRIDETRQGKSGMAMILITADDSAEEGLKKSLPDWTIGKRNGGAWG